MSVSLHVVDEGAGPAVVLLHGFPDSSALWRYQIPVLVEAGYRVIAPDLRGFGAGVAEEALPRDDWALLRSWLAGQGSDLDRYVTDLSRPGALTAALNWYRANLSAESFGMAVPLPLPPVACPVLGVSSDRDVACGEAQMMASRDHVTGPWRHHRIAGAGHWIPLAAPDELGKLIIDHLRDLP